MVMWIFGVAFLVSVCFVRGLILGLGVRRVFWFFLFFVFVSGIFFLVWVGTLGLGIGYKIFFGGKSFSWVIFLMVFMFLIFFLEVFNLYFIVFEIGLFFLGLGGVIFFAYRFYFFVYFSRDSSDFFIRN